jgi:hypothetical protein
MSQDFGQGIFTMDTITTVSKTRDLSLAKGIANAKIDASTTALPKNIEKARALVLNARSVSKLAIDMSNFSLSHQGMKVIR